MYTAKEYQQLILNILEMKVRGLDKKNAKSEKFYGRRNSFQLSNRSL